VLDTVKQNNNNNNNDGGIDIDDVPSTVPPLYLQNLVLSFYGTNVVINTTRMKEIELNTMMVIMLQ